MDAYFHSQITDETIKRGLMEMRVAERKRLILKGMDQRLEEPNAWFSVCLRNFRDRELEKRVTGSASVYGGYGDNRGSSRPRANPDAISHQFTAGAMDAQRAARAPGLEATGTIHNQVSAALGMPPPWATQMMALWPT